MINLWRLQSEGSWKEIKSSERSFAAASRLLQSQDCQDMEHVASISWGGFNRQDILRDWTSGVWTWSSKRQFLSTTTTSYKLRLAAKNS